MASTRRELLGPSPPPYHHQDRFPPFGEYVNWLLAKFYCCVVVLLLVVLVTRNNVRAAEAVEFGQWIDV